MKTGIRHHLTAALLALGLAPAAQAGEWALGIGANDIFDDVRHEAVAGLVEYHSDPFVEGRWGSLSAMFTTQFDTAERYFAGLGAYGYRGFMNDRWFLEGSFAMGIYHQGTFTGKGARPLQFRSSLGVGLFLANEARLSISIDHTLDRKFQFDNPGKEAILIRYTRAY